MLVFTLTLGITLGYFIGFYKFKYLREQKEMKLLGTFLKEKLNQMEQDIKEMNNIANKTLTFYRQKIESYKKKM